MARPIVRNIPFSGLSVNFSGPPGGFVWTVQVTVPKAQPYQSYLILLNGVQMSSMQGTAVYGPIQLYQGDELTITNNAGGVDAGQSGILYGQIDAEGHQPSGVFPAVSGGTVQTTGLNQIIWQGIWDSSTTYQVNDLVEYNGSSYIAIAVNSDTVPTNTSFWNLVAEEGAQGPTGPTGPTGPVGMNWTGAWSSTTAYAVGDGVYQNGSSYICTVANTNEPPPDTSFWNELASEGATGPTGPTGPAGATGPQGPTGPVGMNWTGAWSSTTAYAVGDGVYSGGSSYICITANTNSAPPSADWSEIAAAATGVDATSIQGVAVSATAPATGQTLEYNGTEYAPATPGGGALTSDSSFITSAVTLAQTTATNLTSLSLAAGTWLINWQLVFEASGGSAGADIECDGWIGPNSASSTGAYSSSGFYQQVGVNAPYDQCVAGSAIVTLTTTTTVYLQALGYASSAGATVTIDNGSPYEGAPNASGMTAVKIA